MAFLYWTDAGDWSKLKLVPVVSLPGLILTLDSFPGLVLCPSCKNAHVAMKREGNARGDGAATMKELMGLGLFLSALGSVYETVALRLQDFIFYFLDTIELHIH